ncbi:MAG: LPS export ABC transporter permease LptG [Rhodospirillales bacterium]|nr:LPS export ABC transporter permease LptG [Rhodospirillales bacterium]
MRLSPTLSMYIGRHFLASFATLFCLFLAVIVMFDIVELMRRAASRPEIGVGLIFQMALLRLPHIGQQSFHFAALCGGMLVFWRLTRTNELVVTRAAGVSAWQFLLPVLGVAFLLGVVKVTIASPLAAALLSKYERLETTLIKGHGNVFALSDTGFWLRQSVGNIQSVIHASFIVPQGIDFELHDVDILITENQDKFSGRIWAEKARLQDGFWRLETVRVYQPDKPPRLEAKYWLETDLTLAKIQESFAPPETMSFWALPAFIRTLENAGFSAMRHRLHWHVLLASPLLMCAMVLLAATFTLRHSRRGGTTAVVALGLMTAFLFYLFSDIVYALGLSDSIPVTLAAWTPAVVSTLLGIAMLLHLEDG